MCLWNDFSTVRKSIRVIKTLIAIGMNAQETEKRETDSFHSLSIIGKIRCELYKSDTPGLEILVKGSELEDVITELRKAGIQFEIVTIKTDPEMEREVRAYVKVIEKGHKRAANSKLLFKAQKPDLLDRAFNKEEN